MNLRFVVIVTVLIQIVVFNQMYVIVVMIYWKKLRVFKKFQMYL